MNNKILIYIGLCTILLTGCWDKVEMQDLSIVTAAAIDRLEDGKTRISIQIFIPRSITSGETGEDLSSGSTFVREGVGNSLAEAISKLQFNVPRTLFWSHCKIYIFGEELAKEGIRDEADYIARHPGLRGSAFLFVSEGEARELVSLIPPLERYSAEALRKLTEHEPSMITSLRDVDMGLMGDSESISLPYIKKLIPKDEARKPHETIPVINGTAIFKKDKMVGTLNLHDTNSLLWLKKGVKQSTISIKPDGDDKEIILSTTSEKHTFIPQIKDNRWIMDIKIDMEGDIIQNETNLDLLNEVVLQKIQKKFDKSLEEKISKTIKELQLTYNADVVHFARRFHQKFPDEWKKEKNNWDEKFKELEVNIKVNTKIKRPGYIGPPAGLPREEVKE
ncbi:Ger(x)C family spore germination protein [Lederbergia graminis]|uniref:Ger(X)C family spore germination protein n=1 Tax=Lederbergia graminis TaxID=735518 RepID=A0ABW0LPE8_9BACI